MEDIFYLKHELPQLACVEFQRIKAHLCQTKNKFYVSLSNDTAWKDGLDTHTIHNKTWSQQSLETRENQ